MPPLHRHLKAQSLIGAPLIPVRHQMILYPYRTPAFPSLEGTAVEGNHSHLRNAHNRTTLVLMVDHMPERETFLLPNSSFFIHLATYTRFQNRTKFYLCR